LYEESEEAKSILSMAFALKVRVDGSNICFFRFLEGSSDERFQLLQADISRINPFNRGSDVLENVLKSLVESSQQLSVAVSWFDISCSEQTRSWVELEQGVPYSIYFFEFGLVLSYERLQLSGRRALSLRPLSSFSHCLSAFPSALALLSLWCKIDQPIQLE
jgi:hypothetical protein